MRSMNAKVCLDDFHSRLEQQQELEDSDRISLPDVAREISAALRADRGCLDDQQLAHLMDCPLCRADLAALEPSPLERVRENASASLRRLWAACQQTAARLGGVPGPADPQWAPVGTDTCACTTGCECRLRRQIQAAGRKVLSLICLTLLLLTFQMLSTTPRSAPGTTAPLDLPWGTHAAITTTFVAALLAYAPNRMRYKLLAVSAVFGAQWYTMQSVQSSSKRPAARDAVSTLGFPLIKHVRREGEALEKLERRPIRIGVFRRDRADTLRMCAFYGDKIVPSILDLSLDMSSASTPATRGIGGYAAWSGRDVFDPDLQENPEAKPYVFKVHPGEHPDRAMVCLPIRRSARVVGVYAVSSVVPGEFLEASRERILKSRERLEDDRQGLPGLQ